MRHAAAALTLALLTAAALAACGGGGTKTVTPTQTSAVPTTTTTTSTATSQPPPARTAPAGIPTTTRPASTTEQQDAKAKADARTAVAVLEVCFTDKSTYAGCRGSGIPHNVEVVDLSQSGYQITASSESGDTFTVTKSSSGITRTCSPPGSGGCPSSGRW